VQKKLGFFKIYGVSARTMRGVKPGEQDFSALQIRRRHFRAASFLAGHFGAGLFRCQTISAPAPPDFPQNKITK